MGKDTRRTEAIFQTRKGKYVDFPCMCDNNYLSYLKKPKMRGITSVMFYPHPPIHILLANSYILLYTIKTKCKGQGVVSIFEVFSFFIIWKIKVWLINGAIDRKGNSETFSYIFPSSCSGKRTAWRSKGP